MLLDTSGLLCLHNSQEPQHQAAWQHFKSRRRRLTHSYVLAEFITLAQVRGLPRTKTLTFARDLLRNPAVEVVWVDAALHEEAMRLLEQRPDKSYSLCDAVSFVLLRERSMKEALTTDHHFEQESFRGLLT